MLRAMLSLLLTVPEFAFENFRWGRVGEKAEQPGPCIEWE
jgi:hypothetical protein